MGEYAVVEEGGIGFAVAVERRLDVSIQGSSSFTAISRTAPGGEDRIDLSDLGLLVPFVIHELKRQRLIAPDRLRGRLLIDSSLFFADDGRKLGFGSSAAVTVGACAALIRLAGAQTADAGSLMPGLAHRIHRRYQGGNGSGYDIFTSYYGGTGIFVGGNQPLYEPVDLDWLPTIYLRPGARAVRSGSAVEAYRRWKSDSPGEWSSFLRASNAAVQGFWNATSWTGAKGYLQQAKDIGLDLGRHIGVPAEVSADQAGTNFGLVKALGAGNELAALFPESDPRSSAGWLAAPTSTRGLQWR
jgi:mevalonate kinase